MPIAQTVEEAAYNHLQIFDQPVQAWPEELKARIPPFEELYVLTAGEAGQPGPIAAIAKLLTAVPGTTKHLLTGQRGIGKSWALRHLGQLLEPKFRVIEASATDYTGVTVAETEVADVLLIMAVSLANAMAKDWRASGHATAALNRWVGQLTAMRAVPIVPDNTENFGVELSAFFAKFTARMRSDTETRLLIRSVGAEDLLLVVNEMTDALGATGKAVVVLFDDLDKVDVELARKLFSEQINTLARVRAKMVLTLPFAVALNTTLALPLTVLRNVQVFAKRGTNVPLPSAKEHFVTLLGRMVNLDLVDGTAVDFAVANSGGIPREFGRIVAKAFEIAALVEADRVDLGHAEEAGRGLRIDMLRATQDGARRAALARVHKGKQLVEALDRELVHNNLVVEYVNGKAWYDVHPLIAEAVEEWNVTA